MRNAQFLKHASLCVMALGVFFALRFSKPFLLDFWLIVFSSVFFWIILRLFASMAQMLYEIRNESARLLANIERALYHSNSIMKEVRDLIDSEIAARTTSHEDSSR